MVKVAVVGAGYWGPNLIRNFHGIGDSCLRFICDQDKAALDRLGPSFPEVEFTSDYGVVLNSAEVDAVVIATQPTTHFELAREALRKGKHVFVEKPLALRASDAETLLSMSREMKKILMVGHLLRYHPAVALLKGYVDRGELGEILYVYSTRVNLGKVRQDENALWSFAPHDVALILHLMESRPTAVSAVGQSYLREGVEDVVFVTILFEHKRMAHAHVSWLDPHKIRKLTIVGNKKMAVFDDMEASEKIRIYDKGVDFSPGYRSYEDAVSLRAGDILIPQVKMREPLRIECEHFVECIEKGTKPLTDAEEGVAVVRVLEAAQTSLELSGSLVQIG
ncbi:MAG: Gfo/Idh/MocA family oxidoreductase [Candidatus Eiseniibacteriota bacterium]|nr:MAG: Gfo/Idh/MocA family oxidoreductase [Candidatus Eisenbacteria bacterium]